MKWRRGKRGGSGTMPAGWAPDGSRKYTWWRRRSLFQKYLLCLTAFTAAFISTGVFEYQMPDLARHLLPEGYRDFLHTGTYDGFSPGLLLYLIGFTWFLITPVLYVTVLRYRAEKYQQQLQQQYGGRYVTMRGEVVKSYGEKKIADYLYTRGIRYEYEAPFSGYDEYGRYRVLARPDFYLPDWHGFIEYFGMVGSSAEYDATAMWKMQMFYKNGYNAVAVFPQDLNDLHRKLGI